MRFIPLTFAFAALLFATTSGPVLADSAALKKKAPTDVQTNSGAPAAAGKSSVERPIIVITDGMSNSKPDKTKGLPAEVGGNR